MTTGDGKATAGRRTMLEMIIEGREVPDGYDRLAFKTVRPDLTTRGGYKWPPPGGIAEAESPDTADAGVCAAGLHAALTSRGVQGVAYGYSTALVVAIAGHDVIASNRHQLRCRRMLVVDIVDLRRVILTRGRGTDLSRLRLSGIDLAGASLHGAGLHYAELDRACLANADLTGADLREARLSNANMAGASLTYANLDNATIGQATLYGASLRLATLAGADLFMANLAAADLTGADLDGANLDGANLAGANLAGVKVLGAHLEGAVFSEANVSEDSAMWRRMSDDQRSQCVPATERETTS